MNKPSFFNQFARRLTGAGSGERLSDIFSYFWPECVATIVLYALPIFLDSYWVGGSCSTAAFGIFGITATIIQLVFKVADAFSAGTMILCGRYNGLGEDKQVGKALTSAFWISLFIGIVITSALYYGAEFIYWIYGVAQEDIAVYAPFLRLRAISVLGMFFYFPLVGFIRGIKNTKIPMVLFVSSSLLFVLIDYALIFGAFGLPAYSLNGSAIAAVCQNFFIGCGALAYIAMSTVREKYGINFFTGFSFEHARALLSLSWPVVMDKSALAFASMWLVFVIRPLGPLAKASYSAIHTFQRIFILPAVACTTVITFLVSNRIGKHDWVGIKNTTKKTILFSAVIVLTPLLIIAYKPLFFLGLFDKDGSYTSFAAKAFPFVTACVIFDILQVLLAGALRGAGEVKTVMKGRIGAFIFFFVPFSLFTIFLLPLKNDSLKFILIYCSFYVSNALMAIYYGIKLRSKSSTEGHA